MWEIIRVLVAEGATVLLTTQYLDEADQLASDPAAPSVRGADPERVANALAELTGAGVAVAELALGQPSLDEVFLALTGRLTDETMTEEDEA